MQRPAFDLRSNQGRRADPRAQFTNAGADVRFHSESPAKALALDIIPSAIVEPVADSNATAHNAEAARAFGAPMVVAIDNRGDTRTATAAAARAGLTVMGTEMAGAGTVSIGALALCRRGARNVLVHLGALPKDMADPPKSRAPVFNLGAQAHVLAADDGLFEPFHKNGANVSAGQPAGRIHFIAHPIRPPAEIAYRADGILYARRHRGRVRPGNCCLVVASPDPAAY